MASEVRHLRNRRHRDRGAVEFLNGAGFDPVIVRIENTQNLAELYVSEAVVDDLAAGAEVVECGVFTFPAGDLSFDVW
ncbi:hypothetical protein GCM10009000_066460 [Halobacterium noricense]|uniref:Uncharacterized protein n=1 Tax=Haladaptatus pallidirubidus TaxID=1008152 RepID=A0AAV3UH80_9EURY